MEKSLNFILGFLYEPWSCDAIDSESASWGRVNSSDCTGLSCVISDCVSAILEPRTRRRRSRGSRDTWSLFTRDLEKKIFLYFKGLVFPFMQRNTLLYLFDSWNKITATSPRVQWFDGSRNYGGIMFKCVVNIACCWLLGTRASASSVVP